MKNQTRTNTETILLFDSSKSFYLLFYSVVYIFIALPLSLLSIQSKSINHRLPPVRAATAAEDEEEGKEKKDRESRKKEKLDREQQKRMRREQEEAEQETALVPMPEPVLVHQDIQNQQQRFGFLKTRLNLNIEKRSFPFLIFLSVL